MYIPFFRCFSLLLAILALMGGSGLAVAARVPAGTCQWSQPGNNPFMGDLVAAVDHYTDIPAPVRARLKARMAARQYDEIVSIRRDAIIGKAAYGAAIRDMHFGSGQVCNTVDRSAWTANAQERGLVYCESDQCILVPTVCRNVSRIQRERPAVAGASAETDEGGEGGGAPIGAAGLPGKAPAHAAPGTTADPAVASESAGGAAAAALAGMGTAADSPAATDGSFSAALAKDQVLAATAGPQSPGGGSAWGWLLQPGGGAGLIRHDGGGTGASWADLPDGLPFDRSTGALPAVPEPGSWALMLAGLAGLAGWARRRRAQHINPA